MTDETISEQLAEIEGQPQPEPVQVREGRWRTRGGDIRNVTPTPEGDGREERFTWWDAAYRQTWTSDGRYYFGEASPLDLVEYLGPRNAHCSDFDHDCATMSLSEVTKCRQGVSGVIGQQAVALAPVNGICTELQRRQATSEELTTLDEPAWVTRFAKGNSDCSPFVAKDIADQVREMLIYKRAMESMAKQLIHPKMTALELAELQLRGSDKL